MRARRCACESDAAPLRRAEATREPFTHRDLWVSRRLCVPIGRWGEPLYQLAPNIVKDEERIEQTDIVLLVQLGRPR